MRKRSLTCLLALITVATPSFAHDFWLASSSWTPAAGAAWTVTAQVGEHFPKPETGPTPDRVDLWRVVGPQGDVPVTRDFRAEKTMLSADVRLPAAGVYLGVMTIVARTIEMKGQEFTEYLKEEGLDGVIAARQAAGESDKPGKERYARYAKIALRTGAGSAAHLTRPAGLKAEFVPAGDPTSIRPGQSIAVQLIVGGKPVPNATVTAVSAADGGHAQAKTDQNGRVTLALDRAGAWLIKTVHMTRLPPGSTEDWESFWVTLALHTSAT
jgi:uncharacterized GH25 family protein